MTIRRAPTSLYTPNDSTVRSLVAIRVGEVATGLMRACYAAGVPTSGTLIAAAHKRTCDAITARRYELTVRGEDSALRHCTYQVPSRFSTPWVSWPKPGKRRSQCANARR